MTIPTCSAVIHGHFYQPPRDDPWLETVDIQPSATPYHDWNERVTAECYRAVVAARIPGAGGRIADIVNTLERISFNFGPTLLEWLEIHARPTYQAILAADARSALARGGHGNAIAQAYHHSILPLASRREKTTEVRWGIADFRNRFRRDPVGMWLPETAVDGETLDVLAQEGIAFTVLAPNQVEDVPPNGLPGLYRTASGRSLALFIYDGPLSYGVAFGALLRDADTWARAMASTAAEDDRHGPRGPDESGYPHLVSLATDGETYGHHHRFGDMALARVLLLMEQNPQLRVENFASFLARHPPQHEVTLVEPSSWSCVHGVERWRADCGCKMNPAEDTQQEWRVGLREGMDWLASQLHQIFEEEGTPLLGDPWEARDRYGPVGEVESEDIRGLELLEMERQVLRCFTSCGWFFDDLAGLEPRQVLRYASRALDLAGPGGEGLESGFLSLLEEARSNEDPPRSGKAIYLQEAKPQTPAQLRVAAGAALWDSIPRPKRRSAVRGPRDHPLIPGFEAAPRAQGIVRVTHRRTGRWWDVETRIPRPTEGEGAVSVRLAGTGASFLGLDLSELPEAYRVAIEGRVLGEVPDPEQALIEAIEDLVGEGTGRDGGPSLDERMSRVRDLADLHTFLERPIPFDAQTRFYRLLKTAPASQAGALAGLRESLGFTVSPSVP